MLKHWLKTAVDPPPTWEAVVMALRSPIVNEMSVAAQLESKYCTPEQGESSHPTQMEKSEDSLLSSSVTSELMCSNYTIYALIKGDFRFNGTCEVKVSVRASHHWKEFLEKSTICYKSNIYAFLNVIIPSADVLNETAASSPENQLKYQKKSRTCSTPDLESPSTSSVRHSGNTTPSSSEESQKPPFGCGCGKCTFFRFIERGCPTPIPSASSFPYLDLSGLTSEQQQELRGMLRFESQKIMIRFQELVSATIKSFKRRCVPLDELVSHVMALGAFDPVFKEPQVPLFQFCFQKLEAADTIPKLFLVLKDYFSFFNYHIIEHIIKELGTVEDKANLQRYKEDFNQYAKRRVFECLPEFGTVSDADHADIFVKVDSQYDNYTVAQIEQFRHKLSEILCVSFQGILRLCRVDKGCFQLMFQVPSYVQQKVFPLPSEKEKVLAAIGVIRLTCGEYKFLVKLWV